MPVPVPPFTAHTAPYRRDMRPDYSAPPPNKSLQLTFDDGPLDEVRARGGSTAALEKILAELASRSVRGAFFVLGQEVAIRPSAIDAILKDGHTVGNHSYTHLGRAGDTERMLATEAGRASIRDEFEKTHDVVARRVAMRHWRAPRLEGIAGIWQIIQGSQKLNLYLSHSDVHADSLDSRRTVSKEIMLGDFLSSKDDIGLHRATLANRTSVRLLFHVLNSTAAALPFVLDGLANSGYQLADFAQDNRL